VARRGVISARSRLHSPLPLPTYQHLLPAAYLAYIKLDRKITRSKQRLHAVARRSSYGKLELWRQVNAARQYLLPTLHLDDLKAYLRAARRISFYAKTIVYSMTNDDILALPHYLVGYYRIRRAAHFQATLLL